ncbi:MAG: MBL fold metallo-hydrolase [Candidatus Hermodarchaeota archaeon]
MRFRIIELMKIPWIIKEGKFNENITLIDTNMLGMPNDTGIYLIEGTERTALIDSACPQEAENCTKKLAKMGITPDILILTHSHWDHAAGTPVFQEKFPNIDVMVGKSGIEALKNPAKFNDSFNEFPFLPDLGKIEGLIPLVQGEILDLGGLKLEVLETPGHTNCCISIFEPKHKVLFIGDSLGNIWTLNLIMPLIMPPEFSEEKYLRTIDKVKNQDYNSLALAHYGILTSSIAKRFPDLVKSSYLEWKSFFVATWNKNPNETFVINKFVERLNNMGVYNQPNNKFTLEFFGSWMLEGLKSGKLI